MHYLFIDKIQFYNNYTLQNLTAGQLKVLKAFHMVFASLWVGGGMGLVIFKHFLEITDKMSLYGLAISMKSLDNFIIIPGAVGTVATGFIYSTWTRWGITKYRWIMVKWVIVLAGVFLGTFYLSPWANSLPTIVRAEKLGALSNPHFNSMMTGLGFWGSLQLISMLAAMLISILKPWNKKCGISSK